MRQVPRGARQAISDSKASRPSGRKRRRNGGKRCQPGGMCRQGGRDCRQGGRGCCQLGGKRCREGRRARPSLPSFQPVLACTFSSVLEDAVAQPLAGINQFASQNLKALLPHDVGPRTKRRCLTMLVHLAQERRCEKNVSRGDCVSRKSVTVKKASRGGQRLVIRAGPEKRRRRPRGGVSAALGLPAIVTGRGTVTCGGVNIR